jgi:biotin transport system substrate-specific component
MKQEIIMKISVKDLILIPLFTALTAVGAFIQVPLPLVPFTLQTFFVVLSGVLLGAKKGLMSQLLYVFLGLAGIPILQRVAVSAMSFNQPSVI